jgi:hypothetical protein
MTKKPYYKLVVGSKPYTSVDMRFGCGRVRIEVSDATPGASRVIADLCDTTWASVCSKVFAYWQATPGARLTEPADRALRDEIARFRGAS